MNQDDKGDIDNLFILPDRKLKQQVLGQAVSESIGRVTISGKEEEALFNFEQRVNCKL
jgi:hypothetical protein